MDIIIPLLIVLVLIGIPTWLMVRTMNKDDKNTIVYSPEEVTKKLRKGFYLSFWGIDLLFGAIPLFVLILCDLPRVFQFIVPAVAFVVGFIMFFIGRIQVGLMTRYINFCNRERTEFEEWVLQVMISFSLQTCVERSITVRRCKNCGRYFAQTGRVSAEYCDRTPLDGQSSCRAMGAFQQWTLKQADDPVFKIYRREYKRRFAWIKAGRISDSEFYAWSEQAREQKKKCDEGSITAEDFQRWLKES